LPSESSRTPSPPIGRNVVATALGSVEACNCPFTATKTAGSPPISPVNENDSELEDAVDGAADARPLGATERLAGFMLPEG
jgi:hypothetical protein